MLNLEEELKKSKYYLEVLDTMSTTNISINEDISDLLELPNLDWNVPKLKLIPKGDGKFREVYQFNDKESFHLKVLNNILSKNIKIEDNIFSYKKKVSTLDAAKYIQKSLNNNYIFIKLDLKKYFNSVNCSKILEHIDTLVCDDYGRKLLKNLYSLNMCEDSDGNIIEKRLSLIPGSSLASFMSNSLLSSIDKLMIESSDIYSRYSDDILIGFSSRDVMLFNLTKLEFNLGHLGLMINRDKTVELGFTNKVEYLGLIITKDKIDVNKKHLKLLKSNIKSIVKNYKGKNINMLFNKLYRYLYYSGKSKNKYSGAMTYMFGKVTCLDSIVSIDNYIKDTIRIHLTGKNNKGNFEKYPNTWFEEHGYISTIKAYNLFKISDTFLKQFIKDKTTSVKEYDIYAKTISKEETIFLNDLSDMFYYISQSHLVCVNGITIDVSCLYFDFKNIKLLFKDITILDGNKLCCDFSVIIEGIKYNIKLSDNRLDYPKSANLVKLYAKAYSGINKRDANYGTFLSVPKHIAFKSFVCVYESYLDVIVFLSELYLNLVYCNIDTSKNFTLLEDTGVKLYLNFNIK